MTALFVLDDTPAPRWITLIEAAAAQRRTKDRPAVAARPAVEVLFAPIDRPTRRRAGRIARASLAGLDPTAPVDALSDADFDVLIDAGEEMTRELLRLTILDWKGIGNHAGEPVGVTPETIAAFLANDVLFEAADRLFVQPSAVRVAEKNGFAVSPIGIGEAATPASATASSPANRKARRAAKSARTPKTSCKPSRAKKPGTS